MFTVVVWFQLQRSQQISSNLLINNCNNNIHQQLEGSLNWWFTCDVWWHSAASCAPVG